ncbi:MAG: putative 2-dehydropantoate 2-reductase [Kiritimatiellae bacterium]|nr:putative 2-dehydropantoate 2-reductase [Kiritimatiellia bacterium]MCO5060833.1 putative 2-dehydropantoate 2-reductase [Kiritimatiellia bacterium]MCO5068291.1 putative 2-dehydropantoate 2-reductase [Kiritimatiellia bacterium]
MSSKRYAVLGTGALGGYYGARLHLAGHEVHFLLRSDYAHVRSHGLRVDTAEGTHHLTRVHAHQTVDTMPPCDVVMVALKTTQNHLLPALLPKPLAPNGVALMLQNGLGIEEEAAALVGAERVMGGLCFICANKVGPGHIQHVDYGEIMLGDYRPDGKPAPISPRVESIAADLRAAQIPISLADDLLLARWKKLVWNVPYNALSVILRATTDRIAKDPDACALAEALMREVVAAAAAYDKVIGEDFIARMLLHTEKMRPYKTSMMLDFEAGRPLEVDAIYARPLAAARARGVECPRMETITQQLRFLSPQGAS